MTKPKIILVDDTEALRSVLESYLSEDFEVVVAEDGEKGFAAFKKNPDAVLLVTDNQMPKMFGDELIRRIRIERPEFPTILMSSTEEIPNHQATIFIKKVGGFQKKLKETVIVLLARPSPAH